MTTANIIVSTVTVLMISSIALPVHAANDRVPGNNGTLKVHEKGTPSNTESNDPKVCTFNFEAYGLDKDQDAVIVITKQGGGNDKSEVKRVHLPAAQKADKHATYTETEYMTIANGHYKSTAYGKDKQGEYKIDLKAKSKVFKVNCSNAPTDNGSNNPHNPGSVKDTNVTKYPSRVSGISTSMPQHANQAMPAMIAETGAHPLQALFNTLFAGAGVYSALLRRK